MTSDLGSTCQDTDYTRHIQEALHALHQLQQTPRLVTNPDELAALEREIRQHTPGSRGSGHVRGFLPSQGSGLCRHGDIRYDATSSKTCRRGASWRLRCSKSVPWLPSLWCGG